MSQVITSPDVVVVFNDGGKMDQMLVNLAAILGKPIGQIIKERAVMMGRYLAEITPPVVQQIGPLMEGQEGQFDGGSLNARNLQRFAIRRDIKRTYIGARAIFKRLNDSNGATGKAAAKAFWHAAKHGQLHEAKDILRKSGIKESSMPIIQFDGGAEHRRGRTRQGRVNKGRSQTIVLDTKALSEYTKKIEKRGGWTKAAWINAASQVSTVGMSRVKGWIKVHSSSPGTGEDRTSNTAFPAVYLTNAVPWVNVAVSAKTIASAERFFLNNLAKEVETQFSRIIKKSEGKTK